MLQISEQDINALKSIKSQLDSLLGNAGITIAPGQATVSAGCSGCDNGCEGCDGCKSTSTNTGMTQLTLDDIRTTFDNLETLGPVIFNKKFLADLLLKKQAICS